MPRAIMDSRLDLPTPEPAKMPSRWPRPAGTRVSSARTPSEIGASTRWRSRACGARCCTPTRAPRSGGAAVDGLAQTVQNATEQVLADPDAQPVTGAVHRVTGAQPLDLAERHAAHPVGRDADDLGRDAVQAVGRGEQEQVAHGGLHPDDLDDEAEHGADPADPLGGRSPDGAVQPLQHRAAHAGPAF